MYDLASTIIFVSTSANTLPQRFALVFLPSSVGWYVIVRRHTLYEDLWSAAECCLRNVTWHLYFSLSLGFPCSLCHALVYIQSLAMGELSELIFRSFSWQRFFRHVSKNTLLNTEILSLGTFVNQNIPAIFYLLPTDFFVILIKVFIQKKYCNSNEKNLSKFV